VELGTLEDRVLAVGDMAVIVPRNAEGTKRMVASEAITSGNPVYAAASGKVAASGTVYCGTALEAATANNDEIEVLPGPNTDISTALSGTSAPTFEVDNDSAIPKIALASYVGGSGDYTTTLKPEATLSADNTITVPEANGDVLAALALAQTLTNKTLGAGTKTAIVDVTAAGSGQGTAAALTAGVMNNVTAGDGTKCVVLPAAEAGLIVEIYHAVATVALPVFPASGDTISGGSANAAVNMEGKTGARFVCIDATNWSAIFTANT
jgi:hypothetical protein